MLIDIQRSEYAPEAIQDSTVQWFVAKTRVFRQELKIRDWALEHGIEVFVPLFQSQHKALKTKETETPVLATYIFLRTTKKTACALVADIGLPMRYLIDSATHRMMVVPDKEMEDFQRVFDLSTSQGGLLDRPVQVGDRVQVTRGTLKGVEGHVVELRGKTYVAVSLAGTIWTKAQVPRAWLEYKSGGR